MGLDMYALSVDEKDVITLTPEVVLMPKAKAEELQYWRKHHDLHGYMESLYKSRGGDKEFNCIPIALSEADLDDLEDTIRARELPPTTGFFFGENPPCKESDKEDLKFIAKARKEIKKGRIVVYNSWW